MLSNEQLNGLRKLILDRADAITAFSKLTVSPRFQLNGVLSPETDADSGKAEMDTQTSLMVDGLIASCVMIDELMKANLEAIKEHLLSRGPCTEEYDRKVEILFEAITAHKGNVPTPESMAKVIAILNNSSLSRPDYEPAKE